jgi:hypothetical protein
LLYFLGVYVWYSVLDFYFLVYSFTSLDLLIEISHQHESQITHSSLHVVRIKTLLCLCSLVSRYKDCIQACVFSITQASKSSRMLGSGVRVVYTPSSTLPPASYLASNSEFVAQQKPISMHSMSCLPPALSNSMTLRLTLLALPFMFAVKASLCINQKNYFSNYVGLPLARNCKTPAPMISS